MISTVSRAGQGHSKHRLKARVARAAAAETVAAAAETEQAQAPVPRALQARSRILQDRQCACSECPVTTVHWAQLLRCRVPRGGIPACRACKIKACARPAPPDRRAPPARPSMSCAPGTYNPQRLQRRCLRCSAGTFQDLEGSVACKVARQATTAPRARRHRCLARQVSTAHTALRALAIVSTHSLATTLQLVVLSSFNAQMGLLQVTLALLRASCKHQRGIERSNVQYFTDRSSWCAAAAQAAIGQAVQHNAHHARPFVKTANTYLRRALH
jgi:hypothetical protein